MNLYYAIIIYNKECENSVTLKKLKQEKNIIIVDNSTLKNNNAEFCTKNNIKYINMDGNAGLSKAYNKVLENLIKENVKEDYIMWLDDDTNITKEYIDLVKKNIGKYDVILPIIRCDKKIVSPLKKYGIKYIGFENENYSNFKNIYGINSCLTVKLNLYKEYRYNEKLFLDNIDLDFFKNVVINKNLKIKILESKIQQNLFLIKNESDENFKKRYYTYLKDNYIYNNSIIERILIVLKVFYCSFKYSIKYKKINIASFILKSYIRIIREEK